MILKKLMHRHENKEKFENLYVFPDINNISNVCRLSDNITNSLLDNSFRLKKHFMY